MTWLLSCRPHINQHMGEPAWGVGDYGACVLWGELQQERWLPSSLRCHKGVTFIITGYIYTRFLISFLCQRQAECSAAIWKWMYRYWDKYIKWLMLIWMSVTLRIIFHSTLVSTHYTFPVAVAYCTYSTAQLSAQWGGATAGEQTGSLIFQSDSQQTDGSQRQPCGVQSQG